MSWMYEYSHSISEPFSKVKNDSFVDESQNNELLIDDFIDSDLSDDDFIN